MKTCDLIGPALDWAVAECEGATEEWRSNAPFLWDGMPCVRIDGHDVNYKPSTDWSQGGPIIEREGLLLRPVRKEGHKLNGQWLAMYGASNTGSMVQWTDKFWVPHHYYAGPTPLIAAMRCYIASKLEAIRARGYKMSAHYAMCKYDDDTGSYIPLEVHPITDKLKKDDPLYQEGFQAGAAGRDAEIAALKADRAKFYEDYRKQFIELLKRVEQERDELRA